MVEKWGKKGSKWTRAEISRKDRVKAVGDWMNYSVSVTHWGSYTNNVQGK